MIGSAVAIAADATEADSVKRASEPGSWRSQKLETEAFATSADTIASLAV